LVAVAGTAMVEADAARVLGKFSGLEFPGIEQADQPWNEQDRFALATLLVVQRDMTDIDAGPEHLRHTALRRCFAIAAALLPSASVRLAGFRSFLQGRRPARNVRRHSLAQEIGAAVPILPPWASQVSRPC